MGQRQHDIKKRARLSADPLFDLQPGGIGPVGRLFVGKALVLQLVDQPLAGIGGDL